MKSKQGNVYAIIMVVGVMAVLICGGLLLAFGSSMINWVMDEAVPELTSLGTVGSANLSSIASYGLDPVNSFVQSWTWMTGVIYFLGLIGCLGLAFVYRSTGENWTIGLFFGLMLVLILGSIFMSVIYEELYDDNDAIGTRLKEQTLLSFLIIYSPMIFTIIGFICGIIIYTGDKSGGFV